MRRVAARIGLVAVAAATAGCLEYSPHALPMDSSERDLNRKAVERIVGEVRGPVTFAVIGDTQRSFDDAQAAVRSINQRGDVQFVVQIGDLTHMGLLLEFQLMKGVLDGLDVPYFVVIGNHDLLGNGRAIYRAMFGPENFTFTLDGVRFVAFDSNSSSYDFDGSVPDIAWLEEALAPGRGHPRAVVFSHIAPGGGPMFDDALTEPVLSLLAASGVELSMHGHAHKPDYREHDGVGIVVVDSVNHRSYVVVRDKHDDGFEFERVGF